MQLNYATYFIVKFVAKEGTFTGTTPLLGQVLIGIVIDKNTHIAIH